MLPPMPQEYIELKSQLTKLLQNKYVEFLPNKNTDFNNEVPYVHLFKVLDILISDEEVYELVGKIKEYEKDRIELLYDNLSTKNYRLKDIKENNFCNIELDGVKTHIRVIKHNTRKNMFTSANQVKVKAMGIYYYIKVPFFFIVFIAVVLFGMQTLDKHSQEIKQKHNAKLISEFNNGKKLFDGENIISKKDGWTFNKSEKIFQKNDKYFRLDTLRLVP